MTSRIISQMVGKDLNKRNNEIVEELVDFLAKHGYNWSGLYGDYHDRNLRFPYQYFDGEGYTSQIDRKMIVIGTEEEWGEHISHGIGGASAKCINNPFVKYVRKTANEFLIYNIVGIDDVEDKRSGVLSAGLYGAFKLDRDLSKEWAMYQVLGSQQKEQEQQSVIQF